MIVNFVETLSLNSILTKNWGFLYSPVVIPRHLSIFFLHTKGSVRKLSHILCKDTFDTID